MSWMNEFGEQIETPRQDPPLDERQQLRATIILWCDLRRAGYTVRAIAECFETNHVEVLRTLKQVPDKVKNRNVSHGYLERLRAGQGAKSGPELRSFLKSFGCPNLL